MRIPFPHRFHRARPLSLAVFGPVFISISLSCAQTPVANSGPAALTAESLAANSGLSAIWANNGEDKIVQSQLRASQNPSKVVNSLWNGHKISLFGARNEVVNFNLILEASKASADAVSVDFRSLSGPGGAEISSPPPDKATIFDWTKRNIELFFVRYLQIKGLSYFAYNSGSSGFDERIVPKGLQRPWKGDGYKPAKGLWTDRPNHDAFYPDIAIPLELNPSFKVAQGTNQGIWVDIYIPTGSAPGVYTGTVKVMEGKAVTKEIPVELTVRNFALPDMPNSKTMLFFSLSDVGRRLTGIKFVEIGTPQFKVAEHAAVTALQIAHRHKISLITDWQASTTDHPSETIAEALTGKMFTPAQGYGGPGVNTGINIYTVLGYGGFRAFWKSPGEADVSKEDIWKHSDNWENWFQKHSPSTDRFLYLCDECFGNGGGPGPKQVDQWAEWMKENPGIGKNLKSFATITLDVAAEKEPHVDYIANTSLGNGNTTPDTRVLMTKSIATIRSRPGTKIMFYNPGRPGSGTFVTEDDGVALREVPWAQYKKGIDRLFYWQSTYYWDFQNNGKPETNVFEHAATFGGDQYNPDDVRGEYNQGHTNGEGVLFYPGTDVLYPKDSYGVDGMFASLRLKYWRRGIQDVDYLTLAAAIDPVQTRKIVDRMIPRVFWDYKDLGGWIIDDISWSINPDDWEAARAQLAKIIEKGAPPKGGQ
jgi:hypothetical protein